MKSYINVCSRIYFDPSTPRNMHFDIYIKTLQGHKTGMFLLVKLELCQNLPQ